MIRLPHKFYVVSIYAIGVALCVEVLFVLFNSFTSQAYQIPSDKAIIAAFQSHAQLFEQLCAMTLHDLNLDRSFSSDDWQSKTGPQRLEAYHGLLAQIEFRPVIVADPNEKIRFIMGRGWPIGAEEIKGLECIPDGWRDPGVVLDSLDRADKLPEDEYLRFLTKHWYLFYEKMT